MHTAELSVKHTADGHVGLPPRELEAGVENVQSGFAVDVKTEGWLTRWVTVLTVRLIFSSFLFAAVHSARALTSPTALLFFCLFVFPALLDCHGVSILGERRASQQMAEGWHGHRAQKAVLAADLTHVVKPTLCSDTRTEN